MVINHGIKRFLFKCYAPISALVFAAAMVLAISGELDWQKFAAITVGAYAFAFAVQKQNLEETRLFKELFEQFNARYDKLNDKLNRIYLDIQPADNAFKDDERKTLYKYFNLCGEEWLYAEKGFIDPEVWAVWKSGMNYFRKNSRIKDFWDKELSDNRSYYGLAFQENIGPVTIGCKANDWRNILKASLCRGDEVDLVGFNGEYDADYCRELALKHSMIFEWTAGTDDAFFKKAILP
jgi:hypothetical protein